MIVEQDEKVVSLFTENPTIDVYKSHLMLQLGVQISQPSVFIILKKYLNHYTLYKPLYNQFFCDGDSDRRLQFCQEIQAKFNVDSSLLRKRAISDKCVFCGNMNKRNAHYWTTQNPMFRIGNK